MKHISILIPKGHTSVVNIAGAHQILSTVNEFLEAKGREPVFKVQLVGLAEETRQTTGLYSVMPHVLMRSVKKTDLIIIPAIHSDPKEGIEMNREFIPWVVEQYKGGAEVASFCVGAYFLAATGLVNGKQCATHWMHAAPFKAMYPEVNVVDDKILTEEDGIYTSGGAYSYLNLLLYLIEKHAGRDIAVLTAKTFMIDMDKFSQSPFIMFQGQKNHEDTPILKAQDYIEQNYDKKITVDELASMLALSRRNLERRFKKATANTVVEYIQRVKIEAAKMNLESSRENVNEVMFKVGYSDVKAFRNTFKRLTGLSPVQYRSKYNKEAVLA